jgi:hypothetical protein
MSTPRLATALGLFLAILVGAACGEKQAPPSPAPAPAAAPTAVPTAEPSPTPAERVESAVFERALPTPTARFVPAAEPPVDVPARAPVSRAEEISRCLLLNASIDPGISFANGRVRLEVRARSICGFAILASETGFIAESFPLSGGPAVARQNGAFQSDLEPGRDAATLIELDCPGWRNCRYAVRPVGAAAE